ncbi:MAG: hypothetical protein OEZ36_01980 [Spirochaetota bacterium]|nr:hypothetical protein [Spirochaetota bacterium]
MSQEHKKFKLFTKDFSSQESLKQLLKEIEKWVADEKVAPKSIGVEYLEKSKHIVMSIGYQDDNGYKVQLSSELVSKIDLNADYSQIEKSMAEAASKHENIICHELFITDSGDFHMVFMVKVAG